MQMQLAEAFKVSLLQIGVIEQVASPRKPPHKKSKSQGIFIHTEIIREEALEVEGENGNEMAQGQINEILNFSQ